MAHTNITANDLGLTVERKEREIFKWFLAAFLFGKHVGQDTARQTWEAFMKHGLDSPKKIADKSKQQITEILGEGNFRRYGETTANNLHDLARMLVRDYHGNLLNMYDCCGDDKEFIHKLQKLGGVGPLTTDIFMREAQPVLVRA